MFIHCHVEIAASLCLQSRPVIFICHLFVSLLSPSLFCLPVLVDDVNANPNKRQRQPALLGDHPPEYGKVLRPDPLKYSVQINK